MRVPENVSLQASWSLVQRLIHCWVRSKAAAESEDGKGARPTTSQRFAAGLSGCQSVDRPGLFSAELNTFQRKQPDLAHMNLVDGGDEAFEASHIWGAGHIILGKCLFERINVRS